MGNDTFGGQFDSVKPGDRIAINYGAMHGTKFGKVYGKGRTKFGRWIRVIIRLKQLTGLLP